MAVIRGVSKKPRHTRLAQTLTFAQYTGKIVVRLKMPKRPGKLPAVTQQQVALWDFSQQALKQEDPVLISLAYQISDGTAFYARDILTSAMYGNYVSWPGFGMFPNGPTEGGVVDRVPGSRAKRPPPFGQRAVNLTTSLANQDWTGNTVTIDANLVLPGVTGPMLWMSCETPQYFMTYAMRGGELQPHGKKCWVPSVCGSFPFTSQLGPTSYHWDLTPCCQCGGTCYFWIGELDAPATSVMWTTLPYPCPPCSLVEAFFLSETNTTATVTDFGNLLFEQTSPLILLPPLVNSSPYLTGPAGGMVSGITELNFNGPPGTVGAAVLVDNLGNILATGPASSGPGQPGWIVELSFENISLGSATGFAFGILDISGTIEPPFTQSGSDALWVGPDH